MHNRKPTTIIAAAAIATALATPVHAELSAEELAKLAQNPVGNLISVPFQNNTNLNYGPLSKTQNILNIQPVIPIDVNSDWNIITRTIIPLVWQPALSPTDSSTSGIGPAQFSAFLSPADPKGGLIWGLGGIAQLPTTSDSALGSYRWGLGPTFVILHLDKGNPWVYGVLVNNVWSVGSGAGGSYNNFLLQPFLNYNFEGGTYLTSSPILTANWKADSGNQWTVPLGGGIGHIFHLGRLPVNTQIGAYYNVVKPDYGPHWQVRAQVQFMFPK
ncbi:MAG: transporter [Burkholderiales bacterium]|nr:transporter [Burkholderiales bacterium]